MNVQTLPLGPLQTNCYILYKNNEALIIDPGNEAHRVIEFIESQSLIPQAILLTHAHYDHVGAVDEVRKHYQIDVYLHEAEAKWISDPPYNSSGLFKHTEEPEHILTESDLTIGDFTFTVIHTPGHSPGSVSFIFHNDKKIFSGDVLFKYGVGRTDLYQSSPQALVHSLREKLYKLPDDFIVYPGHGTTTSIGEEKLNNPYVPA